jgi:spore coat polysaccharide biosynthesis predicted glycosyltransferase SpsG
MKAAIRFDAASGHGHRVRCGALAEALREIGFDVELVDGDLAHAVDLLVVDHYELDAQWESAMRRFARRVAVIDDFPGRPHDCDLLVDPDDFDGERRDAATLLLGPCYILLRPEFAAVRQDRERHPPRTLFVAHAPAIGSLRELRIKTPSSFDAARAARSIAAADVAVVAGGMTMYEACCAGTPAIVTITAENQRRAVDALAQRGAIRVVSDGDYRAALDALTADDLRAMSRLGMELIDGRGCERVAEAMLELVRQ